jgi:hypothetical protein
VSPPLDPIQETSATGPISPGLPDRFSVPRILTAPVAWIVTLLAVSGQTVTVTPAGTVTVVKS